MSFIFLLNNNRESYLAAEGMHMLPDSILNVHARVRLPDPKRPRCVRFAVATSTLLFKVVPTRLFSSSFCFFFLFRQRKQHSRLLPPTSSVSFWQIEDHTSMTDGNAITPDSTVRLRHLLTRQYLQLQISARYTLGPEVLFKI